MRLCSFVWYCVRHCKLPHVSGRTSSRHIPFPPETGWRQDNWDREINKFMDRRTACFNASPCGMSMPIVHRNRGIRTGKLDLSLKIRSPAEKSRTALLFRTLFLIEIRSEASGVIFNGIGKAFPTDHKAVATRVRRIDLPKLIGMSSLKILGYFLR
jgi:hypothetical protein